MRLKSKLPLVSEDEKLKLLATNGMLVNRPIVVAGEKYLMVKIAIGKRGKRNAIHYSGKRCIIRRAKRGIDQAFNGGVL